MGMSASQARYLNLTARKSDLEYQGQKINQSRSTLANKSADLYSSMLTMTVPTPPVESDYMKEIYSYSMDGNTTTLSSYKLSMGKDGYNYDIIYSKPASSNILTASTTSNVQKSVKRLASNGTQSDSTQIKVNVGYKNSDGEESFSSNKSPKISRLIEMTTTNNGKIESKELSNILTNSVDFSLMTSSDGTSITDTTKFGKSTNAQTFTYNDGKEELTLTRLTNETLKNLFGGTSSGTEQYNAENGLLEKILGTDNITTNGNGKFTQVYMDQNGDVYVMTSGNGENDTLFKGDSNNGYEISENTSIKKYKLTDILGLSKDTSAKDSFINNDIYYSDIYTTSADQSTDRIYLSGFTFLAEGHNNQKLSFNYSTAKQNDLGTIQTINGNQVNRLTSLDLKSLGIEIAENQNEDGATDGDNKNQQAITYNYYMDKQTGDVWRQTVTTSTSGIISEQWGIYEAQKEYKIEGQDAQLIDESDWPKGIELSAYPPGEYDCYYVPDTTGTAGSYYLVKNSANSTAYNKYLETDEATLTTSRIYEAANTYKIEGFNAVVVSNDKVPSAISKDYELDDYIIYATFSDNDTSFSNPLKYYVFRTNDEEGEAVCSYSYEKSYTGKNELIQARANILVDENGRLAKIDIAGAGTYALEYGNELDQAAYDEAYREYEYKLQVYEKEMSDIDAQTSIIQQQDKKLELQLKSIDTEHSAIQTELEALKKVIENNVKSSFGTFGG